MPRFNDRRTGSDDDLPGKFICPKCKGFIPNNETPGAYPGAISRLDGKTEICSKCGTLEALADWHTNDNLPDYTAEDRFKEWRSSDNAQAYGGAFSWDNPTHYADNEEPNPYDTNLYDERTRTFECPNCGRSNMGGSESRKHAKECSAGE
jgi:predicted RNA-binding Zn-ribbon protein involved in translation (DUF1610 family)